MNSGGDSNKFHFPQLAKTREAFYSGKSLPLEFRKHQLKRLCELFDENRQLICEAAYKDLRKCNYEATLFEIIATKLEFNKVLKHLDELTKDKVLPFNLLACSDKSYVRREPHGVVLIVGTWNYPVYIAINPLASAIAAGNCAVIKPSEVTPHSARLMSKLIPQYLDNDCYHCIEGGPEETKSLLENKFDYIFYTGSTNIGRQVMLSAAKNLTPVTLELGGKSPVYIDDSASSKIAVKRILWGKFINMGQTCIAPDYILCSKKVERAFVEYGKEIIKEWYGGIEDEKLKKVKDFARIPNTHHFRRLKKLLDATRGQIAYGGGSDEADLWIQPTFVVDVKADDELMSGEIFGPILPFVTVNSPDEAIKFINTKSRPLALYVFSREDTVINKILDRTYSGGVCVNDVVFQAGDLRLPFGGTGDSGIGNYHGKYSIKTFTHKRAVLRRGLDFLAEKLAEVRYPPFTSGKLRMFERIMINMESFELSCKSCQIFTHLCAILIGVFLTILYSRFF